MAKSWLRHPERAQTLGNSPSKAAKQALPVPGTGWSLGQYSRQTQARAFPVLILSGGIQCWPQPQTREAPLSIWEGEVQCPGIWSFPCTPRGVPAVLPVLICSWQLPPGTVLGGRNNSIIPSGIIPSPGVREGWWEDTQSWLFSGDGTPGSKSRERDTTLLPHRL